MPVTPALLVAVIAGTGAWHLGPTLRSLGRGAPAARSRRRRVDAILHALMSAAMLAMLWPGPAAGGPSAAALAQIAVLGGAAAWFLARGAGLWYRWFDATSMAAMVWILFVMSREPVATPGGEAGHSMPGHAMRAAYTGVTAVGRSEWYAVVTAALVVALAIGAVQRLRASAAAPPAQNAPGRAEGLVGALMGTGMAISLLALG